MKLSNKLLPANLFPLVLAALFSCSTAPPVIPEWYVQGINAVYPKEKYIAQEGHGNSRKEAETEALAAISRYFITEVETAAQSSRSFSTGANSNYSEMMKTESFVHSASELFAVRYSAVYYDKNEKTYNIAGYIDREEAWRIFEPRVRSETEGFISLWHSAESEVSALKSYFNYKAAENYIKREDFTNTFNTGSVLYPEKMTALAAETRGYAAQLNAKINEARSMSNIYLDIDKDFESIIKCAVTELLSAEGLNITANKKAAQAVCSAKVDEGFTRNDAGDFYYPKLNAVISDNSGRALFSYAASPGKQAAVNAEVAKRRAYTALSSALKNNFVNELNKQFQK